MRNSKDANHPPGPASKRTQHLAILNEIGREISTLTDLPSLMEKVYIQACNVLSADFFFIGLYDKARHEISFPLMYDGGTSWKQDPRSISDDTFSGKIILTKKPLLVNGWPDSIQEGTSPPVIVGDEEQTTQSLMFAPMLSGGDVIGVISVQSYKIDAYNDDDLNLLSGIAHQVAIAVQNAQLLEETKQNAQHLAILNEVGNSVSKLMDLSDLLEIVYEQGRKNISLDVFYVGLYHPETQTISFPIMFDGGKRFKQPDVPISQSGVLQSFLGGETSILINRSEDELSGGDTDFYVFGDENKISASIMAVPLVSRNEIIGMISIQSYLTNAYDEKDVNLLKGIANQVAVAIENSKLFTAAQQEIEERQKLEEQLRAAEARYRELVEHIPAVVYSADTGPEGHWHYVSPQIEFLLGYTADEWLSNPSLWFESILPEDRAYVDEVERDAVENVERIEMEYRMRIKDGGTIWVHDESMNVLISPDTRQATVQGFLMDITARKNAELASKKSEEKYHSLFLTAKRQARELSLISAVQEVLAREPDLHILLQHVVEEIARSFGYTYVSVYLLENNQLHLVHQVGYDPASEIKTISLNEGVLGRVTRTGKAILIKEVKQESNFLRADKEVQSEVGVPLFDGDRICGVLNIESAPTYSLDENDLRLMNTLSEQVNIAIRRARLYTERADHLRREQYINEFAHAISSTLDLPEILERVARVSVSLTSAESATISLISADGNRVSDVYRVNETMQATENIPKGEGLTWQVYEKGRPIVVDDYQSHPDAIPDWVASGLRAFMGIPISAGDKRLGVLSIYNRTPGQTFSQRDLSLVEAMARETAVAIQNARLFDALQTELSEHKITQERLLASVQELESKNTELENFTYTVSHDLKSPIVTISGFLGFLESDIQKGDYDKIPKTISRIREATKKMQQLLNELLELSRIGRLANPPKEIPFGELVSETLELVHGQLREKQVEVKIEADFPTVYVDRIRVAEALQNLLTNAVKFMGGQENPTINIGMKTIDEERVFYIKDNGIGIAPEHHERIFGLFNKLDPFSDGTGIGLTLVKRIIEVHDGRIWVESDLGKGTTFYFTLEKTKQEETE